MDAYFMRWLEMAAFLKYPCTRKMILLTDHECQKMY